MPATSIIKELSEAANVVVTGASSGIGLAATRVLLGRDDVACVFALSRSASDSEALRALVDEHGDRLRPIDVDLTDDASRGHVTASIARHVDAVHLLFNAAGLLHDAGLQPEKSLAQLTTDGLARSFALNAFAPILLAKALLPLMPAKGPCVLASLSARVGSIGDNRLGGWYAYRASKAAQNQLWRTLAVELRRTHPRACCVTLHPGTVDTPLSQPFQARVPPEQLFTPDRAASQLLDIVAGLDAGDSGRFIAWDGQDIPW